jgi:hypothetical protein
MSCRRHQVQFVKLFFLLLQIMHFSGRKNFLLFPPNVIPMHHKVKLRVDCNLKQSNKRWTRHGALTLTLEYPAPADGWLCFQSSAYGQVVFRPRNVDLNSLTLDWIRINIMLLISYCVFAKKMLLCEVLFFLHWFCSNYPLRYAKRRKS